MTTPNWIAAELSFHGIRIWLMRDVEVIEATSQAGVTVSTLAETLVTQPDLPIIMADLTGQLAKAEPASVPVNAKLQAEVTTTGGRKIHLAKGLKQSQPAAVMHGQTASIAGIMAAMPQFDGVILSVGTHSYWMRISAGEICNFQGYLTGDLLKHIGGAVEPKESILEPPEFLTVLDEAISRPQRAYGNLLNLRGTASPSLAGSLIGLELADAKTYWLGETIMVLGPAKLTSLYSEALRRQGVTVHIADHDAALLAGLHSLRRTPSGTIH